MYQFSPSLIKPPRWNVQPHLTAAPELWPRKGYVFANWEGSGAPVDLLNGTNTSFIGSPSYIPTERGLSLADGSDNSAVRIGPSSQSPIIGAAELTVAVYARLNKLEDNKRFYNHFGDGSADNIFGTNSVFGDIKAWLFINDNSGAELRITTVSPPFVDGGIYKICFVWRGGNDASIFVDNNSLSLDFEVTENPTEIAARDDESFLGRSKDSNTADNTPDMDMLELVVSDRAWTDREVASWSNDPFALIRPGSQLLPLLFGGAGATAVTDTALITSAIASPLTANDTAKASDTATITSAAASPLTATETAVANDTAQITAVSATPLTATATASATDTAQITNTSATPLTASTTTIATDTAQITSVTVTTLTASETTSAAVTDTAVITNAAATPLTAQETAIANDTAIITNAIVTTLVANDNVGSLVSATSTAQLTLSAPGSQTITPLSALAYITPDAGSRLVTPNAPGSQSMTPDAPGSTTVTPRAD